MTTVDHNIIGIDFMLALDDRGSSESIKVVCSLI